MDNTNQDRFNWTDFYEAFANKLLEYKSNRTELIAILKSAHEEAGLNFPFAKNGKIFSDICPFTVFGSFNKGISAANRIALIKALSENIGLKADSPTNFDGIPVLNNMKAHFVWGSGERVDEINNMWELYAAAINLADDPSEEKHQKFVTCYNSVINQVGVKWNITMGLFWMRPFFFLNLDATNRDYLLKNAETKAFDVSNISNLRQVPDGEKYLQLVLQCKNIFANPEIPFDSFPALSFSAWSAGNKKSQGDKGSAGWIFQGNPKYYDVIGAVTNLDFITWSTKQYSTSIKEGDRAYIWMSGADGGIVASGIVMCDPELREHIPDSYELSVNEKINSGLSVDIRIEQVCVDRKITRAMFLADKHLKDVSILRLANATNFKLTSKQADIIDSILEGTYTPEEPIGHDEFIRGQNGKRYWMYAPGERSRKWDEFSSKGIMGIGWDELGDLDSYLDREAIRTKMKEVYGEGKDYKNNSLATWQFLRTVREGDVIFAKKGLYEIVGCGIVESDYIFMPDRDEYKHIRKVKWTHVGQWEHPGQAVSKTLTDITNYTDYVRKLELIVADGDIEFSEEEIEIEYEAYSGDNFLDEVFMSFEQYENLTRLLEKKKNIILQGAPGVGKTFMAKRLAYAMIGTQDTSRVMMVQFHQSYSYEDFIMGFRPTNDGFELKPGPFYEFCQDARDDIERDYFFIIDEINRGNLSKIFGELLMLIENDKRGEKLRLLYSNELFSVPRNVYIIGLMNTADRSLAIIDYALRRRFAFFEIEPAFDSPGFQNVIVANADNDKLLALIKLVKELNETISNDESLGDGFRIGHSYFCPDEDEEMTDYWLSSLINFEILPLLREYWFDEKAKVEEWTVKFRRVVNG